MSSPKTSLTKPLLLVMYGFPGAGKTAFARQLAESINLAHLQADRIRHELFEKPSYTPRENEVVAHIMNYMTEEFLNAGVGVVYDMPVPRLVHRRFIRDLARKTKAVPLLVWLQIDADSAFARLQHRDKRKSDDKYAVVPDKPTFDKFLGYMQNPNNEEYIVISGKHTFNTQRNAVMKKLHEVGLVDSAQATNRIVKPGMVNLIPNPLAGRFDITRRNINIR